MQQSPAFFPEVLSFGKTQITASINALVIILQPRSTWGDFAVDNWDGINLLAIPVQMQCPAAFEMIRMHEIH